MCSESIVSASACLIVSIEVFVFREGKATCNVKDADIDVGVVMRVVVNGTEDRKGFPRFISVTTSQTNDVSNSRRPPIDERRCYSVHKPGAKFPPNFWPPQPEFRYPK